MGDTRPGAAPDSSGEGLLLGAMDALHSDQEMDDDGSPTQVNEGRSYDRYDEEASLPPMFRRRTQDQDSGQDRIDALLNQSLDENDTGAVNFSSVASSDSSFTHGSPAMGGGRFCAAVESDPAVGPDLAWVPLARLAPLAPETPGPPKNPFAAKKLQTPLLGGTQLFVETPSSAVAAATNRVASPTSSRPSPTHLLGLAAATTPHIGMSSALKTNYMASDELGGEATPHNPFNVDLQPSSQSRLETTTPFLAVKQLLTTGPNGTTNRSTASLPSSPSNRRQHITRTPAQLVEYVPMQVSQQRREAAKGQADEIKDADFGLSSDDDVRDASLQRHRIVCRKRAQGTRVLSTISMIEPLHRQDSVEVPASTTKDRRPRSQGSLATRLQSLDARNMSNEGKTTESLVAAVTDTKALSLVQLSASETTYGDVSFPPSVIDAPGSRDDKSTPMVAKTPTSSAVSLPEASLTRDGLGPLHPRSSLNRTEAIPETSPIVNRMEHTSEAEVVKGSSQTLATENPPPLHVIHDEDGDGHELPPRRKRQRNRSPSKQDAGDVPSRNLSPWRAKRVRDSEMEAPTSSPPVLAAAAVRPRAHRKLHPDEEHETPIKTDAVMVATDVSSVERSSSSLSSLAATPSLPSREGTPMTAADSDTSALSSGKKLVESVEQDGPSLRTTRLSRHMLRTAGSLPLSLAVTSVIEQSVCTGRRGGTRSAAPKNKPAFVSMRRQGSTVPGVFAGMAFAVSFQSQRGKESDREYQERTRQSEALSRRIQEAGGRILVGGFMELFGMPSILSETSTDGGNGNGNGNGNGSEAGMGGANELQLKAAGAGMGFTALIADGHSRKNKYMEALALGVPCLAVRWVTTCLELNTAVDWTPYVLCAGQSSFLGGALCSQHVVPYDAAMARLADVVRRRSRMLDGVTVLLVERKGQEAAQQEARRKTYLFLALALGARLVRACDGEEAQRTLLAAERAGHPFDWVYANGDGEGDDGSYPTATMTTTMTPLAATSMSGETQARRAAGTKRKRTNGGRGSRKSPQPTPVRLLSNERLVQSLIFGKFIEESNLG